ncbi:hypothetical protein D3C87_1369450 [compost metagenome]
MDHHQAERVVGGDRVHGELELRALAFAVVLDEEGADLSQVRAAGGDRRDRRLQALGRRVMGVEPTAELHQVRGHQSVMIDRGDRIHRQGELRARPLVPAVVLREEGRDQSMLRAAGDHGTQGLVDIEASGRLAFALTVARLDERGRNESVLAAVGPGHRPHRVVD